MNPYSIIPLISSVTSIALGVFVLHYNLKKPQNQTFALLEFVIALCFFSFAMILNTNKIEDTILWVDVGSVAVILLPSVLIHFVLAFTQNSLLKIRYFKYVLYIPFILFILFSREFVKDIVFEEHFLQIMPTKNFFYLEVYGFLSIVSGFLILLGKYFTVKNLFFKKQLFWGIIASGISNVGAIFFILMIEFLKTEFLLIVPISSMITSIIVAYAIVKYKLFVIHPKIERREKTKPKFSLEKGTSYIVKEEYSEKSFEIFVDLTKHGVYGICISRNHPEKIRERFGLKKTPIIWLTNVKGETNVSPEYLEKIIYVIKEFLDEAKNSVVFLDGVEYLTIQNGFLKTLKFLYSLRDLIALTNSRLIIPINPKAFEKKELRFLEREFRIYR